VCAVVNERRFVHGVENSNSVLYCKRDTIICVSVCAGRVGELVCTSRLFCTLHRWDYNIAVFVFFRLISRENIHHFFFFFNSNNIIVPNEHHRRFVLRILNILYACENVYGRRTRPKRWTEKKFTNFRCFHHSVSVI